MSSVKRDARVVLMAAVLVSLMSGRGGKDKLTQNVLLNGQIVRGYIARTVSDSDLGSLLEDSLVVECERDMNELDHLLSHRGG